MDPFNVFVSLSKHLLDLAAVGSDLRFKLKGMRKDPDGLTTQHRTLVSLVAHISEEVKRLKAHSALDGCMMQLVAQCEKLAGDLSSDLQRLSVKTHGFCREVYRIGLLLWKENAIIAKAEDLHKLHSVITAYYQGDVFSDYIHKLMKDSSRHRILTGELKEDVERILSELRTQSQAPSQSLDRLATLISGLPKIEESVEEIKATGKATNRMLETQSERMELILARPVSESYVVSDKEIMRCLEFIGMNEREKTIPVAHEGTYQWIMMDMQPADSSDPLSIPSLKERQKIRAQLKQKIQLMGEEHFSLPEALMSDLAQAKVLQNWLQHDSGVFWINGKPGCGKSTFMKALRTNENVQTNLLRLLKSWAGENEIVIASFYFFQASSRPMQRQSLGLLRSLLHQILSVRMHMLEAIWDQKARREALARDRADNVPWSKHELLEALKAVLNDKSLRVCLLIDGLDEMQSSKNHQCTSDGDAEREILQIMNSLVAIGPHVKLLSAGRKSAIFLEELGGVKTAEFHKLTELDITKVCVERLSKPSIIGKYDITGLELLKISSQIIENASGVFLWVHLVIEMIHQGLLYFEDFDQLMARLRELPPDINKIYERILQSIDKLHIQKVQFWLAIIEMQNNPLLDCGSIYRLEDLALADLFRPKHFTSFCQLHMQLSDWKKADYEGLAQNLSRRILRQCPLLFDVAHPPDEWRRLELVATHRTVLDFLRLPHVRLSLWTNDEGSINPLQAMTAAEFLSSIRRHKTEAFFSGFLWSVSEFLVEYKEEMSKVSMTEFLPGQTLGSQKVPSSDQKSEPSLEFGDIFCTHLILDWPDLPIQDLDRLLSVLGCDAGKMDPETWSDKKREQILLHRMRSLNGFYDKKLDEDAPNEFLSLQEFSDQHDSLLPRHIRSAGGGLWEFFLMQTFEALHIFNLEDDREVYERHDFRERIVLPMAELLLDLGADLNYAPTLRYISLKEDRDPEEKLLGKGHPMPKLSLRSIIQFGRAVPRTKRDELISTVEEWGGYEFAVSPDGEPWTTEQVGDWFDVTFVEPVMLKRHKDELERMGIYEQPQTPTQQSEDSQQHVQSASEVEAD